MLFSTCTFPLKTIDSASRPFLKKILCRIIVFILALYRSNYFWGFFSSFFKLSIGCTSLLICFRTSWSAFFVLFCFLFCMRVPEKPVCLHTAYLESLKFLAAAGLPDMKEQSKPLVCLKEAESLKKTKWRYGRTKSNGWTAGMLIGRTIAHRKRCTDTDAPWYSMSRSLIGRLLLELTRPAGQYCLNVPQVMVCHYFIEWSNTTT